MSKKRSMAARALAALCLLAAVAVSAWAGYGRHIAEASYRTVDISLDYDDFAVLAAQWKDGPEDYWKKLKEAGASSVSVSELSLGWLEDAGFIAIGQLPTDGPVARHLIKALDPMARAMLSSRLVERVGAMATPIADGFEIRGFSRDSLRSVNIGPDDYAAALVRKAGLSVSLRLSGFPGFDAGWINSALSGYGQGTTVIFNEKQVGGFPGLLEEVSTALSRMKMPVGQVEFAGQLGMDTLSALMVPYVVRVHSIMPEELAKGMSVDTVVERFLRAARERSMRVMYVRPFKAAALGKTPAEYNLDYVRRLAEALRSAGFDSGPPGVPDDRTGPSRRLLLALSGLAVAAAAYFVLAPVSARSALPVAAIAALSFFALTFAAESVAAKLVPLAAAVMMPCLAAAAWLAIVRKGPKGSISTSVKAWAAASLISVSGGAMLAAPVADTSGMLGAGLFTGVKLAQVLPLLFAFVAFWAYGPSRRKSPGLTLLVDEVASFGMEPVRWWQAAAVGVCGLIGIYMVLRSGNTSPTLVTGMEIQLRRTLEQLMVFRPRSKEVFIGHPAMLLAGALAGAGPDFAVFAAFLAGMVGQVSMVNTFMHLHTPIAATTARTALGLMLGFCVGIAAALVVKHTIRLLGKKAERASHK